MLIKRILCGIAALGFMFAGIVLTDNAESLLRGVGFLLFIGGITLAYIAIKQTLPNYSFWITLVAMGLAYMLLLTKLSPDATVSSAATTKVQKTAEKVLPAVKKEEVIRKKKKRKRRSGFNLSAYPRISGPAEVIHAHVFYIGGRYVRLFGIDAPDSDQLCADGFGAAYNCGEEAVSWVRNWIDKNPIDCYILKIEPRGQDLATCLWGKYDIGAGLVKAGWGIAKPKETGIYKPYEAKAQAEAAGLWQGTFYAPEDWRNIKRHQNDFVFKDSSDDSGGFFNFSSWFK